MKRSAVAPNVHRRASHQRPQLGEVEFTDIRHGGRQRSERGARAVGNRLRGRRVGRPRREDDAPGRVASRERDDERLERLAGPAAKRVPRAHVHDDNRRAGDARVLQPAIDRCGGLRILDHLERVAGGIRGTDVERREQVPLVRHRCAWRLVRGAADDVRVHPRAPRDRIADAHRRAAGPREPGGPRPAVQVDRDVEVLAPQPPRDRDVVAHASQAAPLRRDDDLREVGIAADDGDGGGFDQVGQPGAGISARDGTQQRRGQRDIADQPQPDEQDPQHGWWILPTIHHPAISRPVPAQSLLRR